MKITDEKWNEIIAETQKGIARWNARALEHDVEDTFTCDVEQSEKYAVLLTRHMPDGERKAVARELTTGELRKATTKTKHGKLVGYSIKTPDPKSWHWKMAEETAFSIVRKLKLTDFLMCIKSTMVVSSASTAAGD